MRDGNRNADTSRGPGCRNAGLRGWVEELRNGVIRIDCDGSRAWNRQDHAPRLAGRGGSVALPATEGGVA
ncbi:hypothetical protein [Corynebacterium atrinae]